MKGMDNKATIPKDEAHGETGRLCLAARERERRTGSLSCTRTVARGSSTRDGVGVTFSPRNSLEGATMAGKRSAPRSQSVSASRWRGRAPLVAETRGSRAAAPVRSGAGAARDEFPRLQSGHRVATRTITGFFQSERRRNKPHRGAGAPAEPSVPP